MDDWNVDSIHDLMHDIETTEGATMTRSALLNMFDYIRQLEDENGQFKRRCVSNCSQED